MKNTKLYWWYYKQFYGIGRKWYEIGPGVRNLIELYMAVFMVCLVHSLVVYMAPHLSYSDGIWCSIALTCAIARFSLNKFDPNP